MNKYEIVYSENAIDDLQNLADYIIHTCKSPQTSKRYTIGIIKTINSLKNLADSIKICNSKSFLQYGNKIRRINYKKMAIIYTIQKNIVLIQRIMPGALISETE